MDQCKLGPTSHHSSLQLTSRVPVVLEFTQKAVVALEWIGPPGVHGAQPAQIEYKGLAEQADLNTIGTVHVDNAVRNVVAVDDDNCQQIDVRVRTARTISCSAWTQHTLYENMNMWTRER